MSTVNANRGDLGMKYLTNDTTALMKVVRAIGHCDFRTAISRYGNNDDSPWVITVGESYWQRHLVVNSITDDDSDAQLSLLKADQSALSVVHIDTTAVERQLTLKELISGSYTGVRKILRPMAEAA